jgi:hypothetical protein
MVNIRNGFTERRRSAPLALVIVGSLLAAPHGHAQNPIGVEDLGRAQERQKQQREQAEASRQDRDQSQAQRDRSSTDARNEQNEAFTIKPESIAFGQRPLFTSRTESFWVRGKGREPVRIASVDVRGGNEKAFTVTNGCQGAVKLEEDCRIDVKFTPESVGDKVAELRIVTGDNSVRTRQLSGTGVKADYKVSTARLQFGKLDRAKGTREQKVTITNTGTIPLPITATSLSGPNEKQFSQSNDCPAELPVGSSCASTVVFRPSFEGQHTATLTIWAKGGAPEQTVALTGTGT